MCLIFSYTFEVRLLTHFPKSHIEDIFTLSQIFKFCNYKITFFETPNLIFSVSISDYAVHEGVYGSQDYGKYRY